MKPRDQLFFYAQANQATVALRMLGEPRRAALPVTLPVGAGAGGMAALLLLFPVGTPPRAARLLTSAASFEEDSVV